MHVTTDCFEFVEHVPFSSGSRTWDTPRKPSKLSSFLSFALVHDRFLSSPLWTFRRRSFVAIYVRTRKSSRRQKTKFERELEKGKKTSKLQRIEKKLLSWRRYPRVDWPFTVSHRPTFTFKCVIQTRKMQSHRNIREARATIIVSSVTRISNLSIQLIFFFFDLYTEK